MSAATREHAPGPHTHPHAHSHPHDHGHRGLRARVRHAVGAHSHDHESAVDPVLEPSAEGLRALWISLAGLAATALAEAAVVALSSALAAYAAVGRFLHPHPVTHLAAVAVAAVIGFAGNELVARYRIRTGRRIGSAALVADGLHARTDGFTSLAVLAGAGGVAIGWSWADPVAGLLITVAILAVGWQAVREVGRRLLDGVDPALAEQAEATLRATPGVLAAGQVRLRWVGRTLRAECEISVDPA